MGARYRYWGCKLLDCRWVNTEPNLQETQNEDIKVCGKCNRELNRYYRDPMEEPRAFEYLNAYYDTTPDETFAKDYLQTEPPRIPHPPPSGRRWENYFSITTGASRGNTEYFACFIDPKNLDLGHPSYTPFSAYESQVLAGAPTSGLPNHPNQTYSPQPSYSNVRSQPPNPYAQPNPQPYTPPNPQPYAQAYPQPSAQPYAPSIPPAFRSTTSTTAPGDGPASPTSVPSVPYSVLRWWYYTKPQRPESKTKSRSWFWRRKFQRWTKEAKVLTTLSFTSSHYRYLDKASSLEISTLATKSPKDLYPVT